MVFLFGYLVVFCVCSVWFQCNLFLVLLGDYSVVVFLVLDFFWCFLWLFYCRSDPGVIFVSRVAGSLLVL